MTAREWIPSILSLSRKFRSKECGQAYAGGPGRGPFLLLTASPAKDLVIPGADYSFGRLRLALARGKFESLGRQRRPVIRLHLSCGAEQGLIQLETILNNALRKRHFAAP